MTERLYTCMRLHSLIFLDWLRYVLAPALFLVASAITALLFITFRPSGLPFLVYCWFPLVAAVAMFIITWQFYDAVVVKRTTDEVLANLQSRTSGYYRMLLDQKAGKVQFVRSCRALQPIRLTIGDLSEFTLEVVMNIWEEVFNQLLFLLSL